MKSLRKKLARIKEDMAKYGADLISSLEAKKEKVEQELEVFCQELGVDEEQINEDR